MHPIDIPRKYVDWVVGRRGRRHVFNASTSPGLRFW